MDTADKPFLFHYGRHIESLTMRYSEHHDTGDNPRPYVTDLDGELLLANAAQANAYLRSIVEALYDRDALDMQVAERINYLSHVVLQDPREALEAAMMQAGEDL